MAAKIAGRINSAFFKCDEVQRTLSKHVTFCKKCNDPACHCNGRMACNDFSCGWGIKTCSAVPWVIGAGLHAARGGFYDQTGHAIGWYRLAPRPAHPSHPLPVSHNPSCATACHARRDGTVSGSGLERSQSDCLRLLGRRGDCSSSFAGLPSATGEKMIVIL